MTLNTVIVMCKLLIEMKEPSCLRYPLATKQFHKLERLFTGCFYPRVITEIRFCDFPNKSLLKKVAVLHACMISKLLHCVELYPWLLIETINWLKNHSELFGKKAAKLACENGLYTLTRKGSKAFGIYAVYSG